MRRSHGKLACHVLGAGAWGPGFSNWPQLKALLQNSDGRDELVAVPPKPEIIPANERRRSPLPVRIAVETSWQAVQQAGINADQLACVFGSGLGDTQITDYMCRTLTTELKQLSPTKFHNSVHNAAAGYWTISTGCMKSATSIAAYHETAGLALLEATTQAIYQDEPVLMTLFDTKAHSVYHDIFACELDFAGALVISPADGGEAALARLEIALQTDNSYGHSPLDHPQLAPLYQSNPAAKALVLFALLAEIDAGAPRATTQMPLSDANHLSISAGGPR